MRKIKYLSALLVPVFCVSCAAPKQYSVDEYRTVMQFHEDFKVAQFTDLHLGFESNLSEQLTFIQKSMLESKADLFVFTGDNFMFANKSIVNATLSMINVTCDKLTSERTDGFVTKFAITYGNHDNQGEYNKFYINDTVKKFVTSDGKEKELKKYAAFLDYNDDNLFGYTNYFIDLVDDVTKDKETVDVKYRLHILDSNTYHFNGIKYGYDVIHEDQLEHINNIYTTATNDKDYIGLAFFHIPFEEFEIAKLQYENAANPEDFGRGEFGEGVSDPYENNGSFTKMRGANIVGYFVGHDHVNASDLLYNADSSNVEDKAIFSYGVKSTNQLYHKNDMIGYKEITLKDNMSIEDFLTTENINNNIKNVENRGGLYE